jgi:hypothetical protein
MNFILVMVAGSLAIAIDANHWPAYLQVLTGAVMGWVAAKADEYDKLVRHDH